ncbi:hypothetical protein [Botryobacter ruber]|uniref:hypothetical protein n=1 Tax=Botryobacter ruber TaxID=2171629 RepID=UPI000E0B5F0A|nr:hypothetical protein [Botryobacter ruber]
MKNIKLFTLFLLASLLFSGCQKEDFVEIDSLSAMGDEFFFGQKVKVWMAVKTSDLPAARYTWSCEGGRLTQPQTLDENTWQAPRAAGTYKISCTVDVNGVKQTRTREMYVSSYFFEKFERTSQNSFTFNSSANSLKEGRLEVRVSSATATKGYIQRAFGDADLKVPFSTQMESAIMSNFPANPITIGSSKAENTLWHEWLLNRDPDKEDNLFIDNIRFEWYPVGRATAGLPVDPNGQPYNGHFRIQQRNVTTNGTSLVNVYVNHPALNFALNQYKKVSMTLDANYTAHVYVDGTEVLKTDAIKDWRATNNSKDDIYLNQWRFNYVSNSGQAPIYRVDNAYTTTDGTILK